MKKYFLHGSNKQYLLLGVTVVTLLVVELTAVALLSADELRPETPEGLAHEIQADAVPDHIISYDDALSPEWKLTWDLARQLYREKKFREALVQYEILLSRKGTVYEARWEYASILLQLERWEQACEQLEQLLGYEPSNKKYLFAMAGASLKCGYVEKAVKIYTRLFEVAADDLEVQQALEGLVMAHELLGDPKTTLPLLEQLIVLQPDNFALRKRHAQLLLNLGDFMRTAELLDTLEKIEPDDVDIIWIRSRLLNRAGDTEGAAACLQKLIALDPENLDAHRELKKYYAGRENWSMSLKHLEMLLKKTPDDSALLEEAGELSMQLGRIDTALDYYDYCLVLNPANTSVLDKKSEAQRLLATDLLVLVENNGSEKLWQDLVKVTADRPGVYREIAALLREKNQTSELIEVLTLLYEEDPADKQTYHELAMLLAENGRESELKVLQRKNKSGSTVQ